MSIPCIQNHWTSRPRPGLETEGLLPEGSTRQPTTMLSGDEVDLPWFGQASSLDPVDDEAARRLAWHLRDDRVRRAVGSIVAQVLADAGYEGVTHTTVARLAAVPVEDVERLFPSREELALSALHRDGGPQAASLTLPGREIVARCLSLWERGDNVIVLREILRAACHDRSLAAMVERHIVGDLIRPFAERRPTIDAYPRARLAFAQLMGLAVSRYVLCQEPLASADHETLAAWVGPTIDRYLRGKLEDDVSSEMRLAALPAR